MAEGLRRVMAKHALAAEEIAWFLPHYSSHFFRPEFERQLVEVGLPVPPERHFTNLAQKGNTGAASIFLILDELVTSGRVREGQQILCFVPESARFSVAFMLLTAC
jgi:3-oxoacyl-[acyl-carrier-protein] synthase-3